MHAHDCIVSVSSPGRMVWQTKVFAAAPECVKHGKLFAAQKLSVCGSDAILTVFGEMCDNRAVRIFDSGIKPSFARFAYP